MDFNTNILYFIYRHRIKQIEKYCIFSQEIQKKQLANILKNVSGTQFARQYGLSENMGYDGFVKNVPIHTYDDIKPYIEMSMAKDNILFRDKCVWFAKSSGTTNDKSKFIPVPKNHLRLCHYRGCKDVLALYLKNNQNSNFGSKKSLVLGGSHSPMPINKGVHAGDLSAILVENMPFVGNIQRVPSKKILLMDEWNSKMEAIVKSVVRKNVGSLSGVPSWMLVMLQKVLDYTGKSNILEVWPSLEVFFHGGISFDPYRNIYKDLIPSDNMHYMETYNASEGFFAMQDDPSDKAMLLMLDYGIFYEFVPVKNLYEKEFIERTEPVPLEGVKCGETYAMIISTLGGLYRYLIGDTVTFVSTSPYKIVISGRTQQYINAFGEELMVSNAEKAIMQTNMELGINIKEYTAAPVFFTDKSKGKHQWLIELDDDSYSDSDTIADTLDKKLQALNSDYEAKRYSNMTLSRLDVTIVPKGFFHKWLEMKGKLGGQHKVPRLCNDRRYIDSMLNEIK